MKKLTLLFITTFLFTACGSNPPKNLNNACAIYKEKKSWRKHARKVEKKWGVPQHSLLAIMHQESRFKARAKTPRKKGFFKFGRISSAYGYSQALDGTWDSYKKSTGRSFASRSNFGDAADFMGWYMNQTRKRTGVPVYDTYRQYLAYHEGQGGYNRGSYRRKPWLIKVARKVHRRAGRYRSQLQSCR